MTALSSGEWRTTHSSEWEGAQALKRERHAHRWPSKVRGVMLAWLTRRATHDGALGSGELIPQNERNSDAQKGVTCSWVTLYGEGSNASSTNKESDLSQSSGERRTHYSEREGTQTLRRERHAHRWPSIVRGAVLARPSMSSGERRTHSSEWEGTQTLLPLCPETKEALTETYDLAIWSWSRGRWNRALILAWIKYRRVR